MHRMLFISFLMMAPFAPAAHAIFIKTQMNTIDHEPLFDEHYFVAVLSFSYPQEWDDLWRASTTTAYRINGASLDCCQLYLNQEFRFQRRLVDGLSFKFRFAQQDDKEREELHYWLELEKTLFGGLSASVFGEPTFQKEDSNIGLGLSYDRAPWKASARHYLVNFDFNRRNHTTQRYLRQPSTDEFSLELARGEHRLTGYLELDHPLSRSVPDEKKVFSYRRTTARLGWRQDPPGGWSRRLEYGYEFQVKGNLFDPDPGLASLENRRQVHQVLAGVEGPLSSRDRLEAGHILLERDARDDNPHDPTAGIFYRRWESQPYLRWRRKVKPWAMTDLGTFLSFGENRQRRPGGFAPSFFDTLVEAKLGAGIDFLFGPSGRIGLYTTFELERPSHLWGGGNARAMFLF